MLYFYLIIDQDIFLLQFNTPFMKKIPDGAEVANVWVGELEGLKKSVTAFIRLVEPRFIGDLSQVALPTRFIFLHLTPKSEPSYAFEIGRAISNMMVDEVRYAGQPAKLPPLDKTKTNKNMVKSMFQIVFFLNIGTLMKSYLISILNIIIP